MKKLLFFLSVLLILMLFVLLSSSCTKSVPAYKFPLSQTDMEEVMKMKNLQYHMEDSKSFSESHVVYTFKTDEGATIFIETQGLEDERALTIKWSLPNDFNEEQLKAFQTEEIPRMFELMTAIYGNKNEAKSSTKDFDDYLKTIDISKDKAIYWTYRAGDVHYLFRMPQWSPNITEPNIGLLKVRNSKAFEKFNVSSSKVLAESARSQDIVLKALTVQEILIQEDEGKFPDEKAQWFIVRGSIDDIVKPKSRPRSLKLATFDFNSEKEGFIRGTLKDSTGSMEIYIQPTSLTDKELEQERNHYIMRISLGEDHIYALSYSTLVNIE